MNGIVHKTICGNRSVFGRVARRHDLDNAGPVVSAAQADYQLVGNIHAKTVDRTWHRRTPWTIVDSEVDTRKGSSSIRGIAVLGADHPGEMSADEFHQRPGALYHGSREELRFNPLYFQNGLHFEEDREGSMTLGVGFYTTPLAEEAAKYSQLRRRDIDDGKIIVTVFRPYQAVLLDLRDSDNIELNGKVPAYVAVAWLQRYRDYMQAKPQGVPRSFDDQIEQHYLQYVISLLAKTEEPDLRILLETDAYPYAVAGELFAQMMVQLGFDGVIYNENGDDKKRFRPRTPSYAFYNLNVFNTHDGWLQQRQIL